MNRFKTLVMYFALFFLSVLLIFGISRVEKRLDGLIAKHNLHFTGEIKNAPPVVAFTTVALGSFRGLLADVLWLRAAGLQDRGNYFEMVQLASWITKLQPKFSGATSYLAWNMAYNISVTCSDFEDRWRWVNEGIKLIRDEALFYNPEDPVLYKELGWIYQHKLGNVMDDANLYYKNKLALAMMGVLGPDPDFALMASSPADEKSFMAKYNGEHRLWKIATSFGIIDYTQLYAAFKKNANLAAPLPAALAERLGELENKEITAALRAAYLMEKFRLDARVIHEINEKYGMLDWRVAESQAIYWATMGLKMTPGHRDLSCERMITQSLYEAFRSGRLLMIDEKEFASIVSVPNLGVVDAVKRTFEEAYLANDRQSTFRSAKINFMKEAVAILFNYGKFAKANEYFRELKKEDGQKGTLEQFVMAQWAETVRDATVKKANDVISGLIYRSLNYLVYGDDDAALANERIARYIYTMYTRNNEDIKDRVGLLPYGEIKKVVVENCLRSFPPVLGALLRSKLEADQAKGNENNAKGINPPGNMFVPSGVKSL